MRIQRSEPGIERAVSIAVAIGRAALIALVASSANNPLGIGFHDQQENGLGDGSQKIAFIMLGEDVGERHSGLRHR